MISNRNTILKQLKRGALSFGWRPLIICAGLLLIISQYLPAQVINNNGAQVNVTSGIYVTSKDAENNSGGTLLNNGDINLTGSYTNNASTSGNGTFRIGLNWTNTSVFIPGNSSVIFNGSDNQLITKIGGETFYNLSLMNSGAASLKYLGLASNVSVLGTLTMSLGNINAGTYLLYLVNSAAAALNYSSTTGSRVLGKFERGVSETANYLFPLGTASYYNPANLRLNSITTSGSVLSQFFTAAPGNNGLPIPDPPVEIANAFPEGYWRLTPNSFSSSNFNINLDAAGFAPPDTVRDVTRLIKRTTGGNWIVDGTHQDAVGNIVFRNNLTGDLDPAGTEFALGRARPLITVHPVNVIQCEHTNAIFSVAATGATPFTYRWYKDGVLITNSSHYGGNRTATLTIYDIGLSDAGNYYCIVSDRDRNGTQSNSASLTVMKIPVATLTNANQLHVCSNIPFNNIILGLSYYDPGTIFKSVLTYPAGITSAIPLDTTYFNIGDFISGSFNNTTDTIKIATFTITPIGPTGCIGNPVPATIRVNPHPRVAAAPLNNLPVICDGNSTNIILRKGSTMTQGVIDYDYKITKSSASVTGNTATAIDQPENHHIVYPYQNTSNDIQSVYYHIMPKNTASGCLPGDTVVTEVKIHPYPLNNINITNYLKCEGGTDASILVTTNNGAGPYYLKWVGPSSFEGYGLTYHDGLHSGRYDIDVTDNLGCTTFNEDYTIIPAGATLDPVITITPKPSPSPGYGTSCWYGNDGALSVMEGTYSTGVAPFKYQLIHNSAILYDSIFSGIGVTHNYNNLGPGNYVLYVKDSNGCSKSIADDIIPPDTIKINFTKKVYPSGYNITCKGENDGSIKASVSGGNGIFSGIYTYKWTTTDGSFTGPDNLDNISNVTAGTYKLTVTDAMLCTIKDSVTVTEPDGMTLVQPTKLSFTPDSAYNISCSGGNNGSIDITVTGGVKPYIYFWTDSASYSKTTEDISNLNAGTYVCKITDASGCTLKLPPLSVLPSFALIEPPILNIASVVSNSPFGGFNINCNGDNSGSINVTVIGGSGGGYQYTWTTTNGSGIVALQEDQTTLTAGRYHLDVTDLYGCHAFKDYTLTEPPKLSTTLVPTHITCAAPLFDNGSIDLTVSGGVAPYTYHWSNGPTSEDISNLTQGFYKVTVTDANGCTKDDTVTINLPPPVQYTKVLSDYHNNGFNIRCNGHSDGSISITPTSGTAPYSYVWSNGATTNEIDSLTAGSYTVTITDALQCKATETITLNQPGVLGMTVDLSSSTAGGYNINCAGAKTGSIDITPLNAVDTVYYHWLDGSASKARTDLSADKYYVIIQDSNNCLADSTITLTEPDSLKLSLSVSEPWCPDKPDGALGATVTGGVVSTDYTYKWSDNSIENSLANILPGIYSVTVTDMNNCVISRSIDLKPQQESCLVIPNAISPNGDLINDVWNIGFIELYPNVEIMIFNRWGETLWRSARGYPDKWDGTSNGSNLPIDSYHYIIDLHNGRKPIVGNVTIVR
jgi:gliding motility-associated-like protein